MVPKGIFAPYLCLTAGLWLAACTGDQAAGPIERPGAHVPDAAYEVPDGTTVPSPAPTYEPRRHSPRTPQTPVLNADPVTRPAELFRPPTVTQPAVRPEPAPDTRPRPQMKLRQLVGLDRNGLSQLLGKPTLLRRETQAEVWQYAAKNCALHVFLYRSDNDGPYQVAYVTATRRSQPQALQPAGTAALPFQNRCLGRLLHRFTTANKTS